jgi:hypothetical protein
LKLFNLSLWAVLKVVFADTASVILHNARPVTREINQNFSLGRSVRVYRKI